MKKLICTTAFFVQVAFAMAGHSYDVLTQPRHENVKMFQQAGTSTAVLHVLSTSDNIQFVRSHNMEWDLISVNGKAGYVLHSELVRVKKEKAAEK